jgi:hypothetical protein
MGNCTSQANVRQFGGRGNGVDDDTVALLAARNFLGSSGGTIYLPAGRYITTQPIPGLVNMSIVGDGQLVSVIEGRGDFDTLTLMGRNTLSNIGVFGANREGTGIHVGGQDFAGENIIDGVRVYGQGVGVRLAGALWTSFRDCVITGNNVGVDFNAASSQHYSTTVAFVNGHISFNRQQGVRCSYVPIGCQSISFLNGSIEGNCVDAPQYAQMELRRLRQVDLRNVYLESGLQVKPTAILVDDCAYIDAMVYINGAGYGFDSGNNAIDNLCIHHSRFIGCQSGPVRINGGAIAKKCLLLHNEYGGQSVAISAQKCTVIDDRMPEMTADGSAYMPIVSGGSIAGSPIYTAQIGRYSVIGNIVYFRARVSISALGGMAGTVRISLPTPSATVGGLYHIVAVECDGVALSGGRTQMGGSIGSGADFLELHQTGSALSSIATQADGLSASTTIQASGWYHAG